MSKSERFLGSHKRKKSTIEYPLKEKKSVFDGFLLQLRERGVRVSTPEWLQFLHVCKHKFGLSDDESVVIVDEILTEVRLFGQLILVKDKSDEASFHSAFDEYFKDLINSNPEIKEQLGIQDVDENLDMSEKESHSDEEEVHGGKEDQHNDILQKKDISKQGGGNKKDNQGEGEEGAADPGAGKGSEGDPSDKGERSANEILQRKDISKQGGGNKKDSQGGGEGEEGDPGTGKGSEGDPSGKGKGSAKDGAEVDNMPDDNSLTPENSSNMQQNISEEGLLIGGGKGKSLIAKKSDTNHGAVQSERKITKGDIEQRKKRAQKRDRKLRYEVRPDRMSIRQVVKNLRRIISDVSEVKSRNVDTARTAKNFARRRFSFDYIREREEQPEIVLFIDVGGPVDEWSPLMKEVAEEMAKGLSKLEVYLFHNNIYGYVWEPDPKDMLASSYAEPNSLIDLKKVVKSRKKVIIYGDAEMSYSEFENDEWPPEKNEERVRRFSMDGPDALKFIKRKAESVVWVNPVFSKEWEERDDSGTIESIGNIIPMHDLTVGGVEDAIHTLMKR